MGNKITRRTNLKKRICKVCGKEFRPTHRNLQIYCSTKCFMSTRRGKTYEEIYGEERAKEIKKNVSNKLIGHNIKRPYTFICVICGKEFKSMYERESCSKKCNYELSSKRLRESDKVKELHKNSRLFR